jgi:NADH dehydrogenase/NADH:ubiquinone oxidoreductase subunit G
MGEITATIDGRQVKAKEGTTILEAARANGIEIPTLCYHQDLTPLGACRLCVVEVEGSRTLVGSCHTPITEGMVIHTRSDKVLATRKMIVELLLASHCGSCYMCEKANICELRQIAADLEVGLPRFQMRKNFYPLEDVSPYIVRDLTKCIMCRRCVRACREIAGKNVFAIAYRGFDAKVVVDCDQPIDKEVCRDCDVCISYCPTGALGRPRETKEEKKGKPLIITG